MIHERAYQSRMITEIRQAVLQGYRKILVVLPTGGGKSVVAARIMQMTASKGNTSAFFAAQRELVYQIGGQLGKLGLAARTIMSGEDDYIPVGEDDPLCSLIARDTLWARAFRKDAIAPPEATVVQVDECVTGDALVETIDGPARLDTIVPGTVVLSRDGEYNVFSRVTAFMDKGVRDTLVIRTSCQEIRCTPEHLLLTKRGWLKAENLETTDCLLTVPAAAGRGFTATQPEGCRPTCTDTLVAKASLTGRTATGSTLPQRRCASADVASECHSSRPLLIYSSRARGSVATIGTSLGTQAGSLIRHARSMIGSRGYWLLPPTETARLGFPTRDRSTSVSSFVTALSSLNGCSTRLLNLISFAFRSRSLRMADMEIALLAQSRSVCRNSTTSLACACEMAGNPSPKMASGCSTTNALHGCSATMDRPAEWRDVCTSRAILLSHKNCSTSGSLDYTGTAACSLTEGIAASRSIKMPIARCVSESGSTSLLQCSTKWERIASISKGVPERVYDITVEGTHNFFANGILVHNCHQSLCPTYQKIMGHYDQSITIGWTATPCRTDNKPLGQYFDKLIVGASYKELQDLGFLVPVRVIAPDRPDLKGCKVSKGDYAKGDLERRMNRDEMVGNIVKEWLKNADGRQTVAFAAGIDHSVHIRDLFRKEGVTAEHIDGKMPAEHRKDIMERAKDGKIRVLCNYGVLTTGVDIPALKYMILARPTKSFGLYRQMGGRIQRPLSGHTEAVIQDHSDCALAFGYPDEDVEWSLDGDDDVAKKHMERKAKEKGEDGKPKGDPYSCEKCHATYRGYACPSCGHRPERAKELKMSEGELKELERSKANKNASIMDKQKFWDECLGWAVGANKKVGAAAHRYKQRYGCFPPSQLQEVPRSSQWQMTGREFWNEVVKPSRASGEISKRYWGKADVSAK